MGIEAVLPDPPTLLPNTDVSCALIMLNPHEWIPVPHAKSFYHCFTRGEGWLRSRACCHRRASVPQASVTLHTSAPQGQGQQGLRDGGGAGREREHQSEVEPGAVGDRYWVECEDVGVVVNGMIKAVSMSIDKWCWQGGKMSTNDVVDQRGRLAFECFCCSACKVPGKARSMQCGTMLRMYAGFS